MDVEIKLSDELFKKIRDLFYNLTGIYLKDYKKYLVEYRLFKLVGPGKRYRNFEELYKALISDKTGEIKREVINHLTTNYTYFFREKVHFDFLKQYLLRKASVEPYIRLWSGGCATGEEAYSMAISCIEILGNPTEYDIKILATDISINSLKFAHAGEYNYQRMAKGDIEDHLIKKYFLFNKEKKSFIVKDEVKSLICFRYLNLMDAYPFRRKFDIVFLRNVLIYFSNSEKEFILTKIFNVMKEGGYLILGMSESLVGIKHRFILLKNSIYQKV